MSMRVIDNYLPENSFNRLRDLICFNGDFPFSLVDYVSENNEKQKLDDWYGVHIFYKQDVPQSPHYNVINEHLVYRVRMDMGMKSFMRGKCNFYGHTQSIVEHQPHYDFAFNHTAAIYSLNTCDGFTRIGEKKVDSVANRIVFFDGSEMHNSSSTTNTKGRFNISINFI